MSKKLISTVVLVCFTASCLDAPLPAPQPSPGDTVAVLPSEEPPAVPPTFEGDVSVVASDCLDCLGSLSSVCVDETAECTASLSCNVWLECTENCVLRDGDETCHEVCDDPTHEFFTPQKMKKCSCEVCYAQCLNMCPAQ